jgi:cytochrome P450
VPTNLTGRAAVLAALTSADLTVPPVPAAAGPPSLAWLRAHVPRFSSGVEHGRRRTTTVAALANVDTKILRDNAFRRTRDVLAGRTEVELMAEVARRVPVAVLAEALGMPADGSDVATVARVYLTGPPEGSEGSEGSDHSSDGDGSTVDAAVARLVAATGRAADEEAATLVGLLVQAYEATAGLIACLAALREPTTDDPAAVVEHTLHADPPTLATRRLATVDTVVDGVHIGAGEIVRVDLASADRSLGAGPHACPGAAEARAIAAGVVAAVRGCRLTDEPVAYLVSPNLRVPARLMVTT